MKSTDSGTSASIRGGRRRFDVTTSRPEAPPSARTHATTSSIHTYCQASLQRIADRLRESLRCDAVAIRLMGHSHELRYAASSGRTFAPDIMSGYDQAGRPHCVCDQVCLGDFDHDLACFTPAGSFVVNSRIDSLALRRRDSAPRFAHLLNGQAEFQSLIVAPIRAAGVPIGVVQCADARPNHFGATAVDLVETVVSDLAHDIYYDSMWQPRAWATDASEGHMMVSCPICGRERSEDGMWHAEMDRPATHRMRQNIRHVVCPSCLRLCNFE